MCTYVRANPAYPCMLRLSLLHRQGGMLIELCCDVYSDLIRAALLAAAEQVEYRHDTRPFLPV